MSKVSLKDGLSSMMAKLWNRESIVFFFLFLMSAAFWVLMTLNESYERDIKVPVKLINAPHNILLLDDENDTLTVNVRATGTEYLYKSFGADITVYIDFRQYKQNDRVIVSNTELQKLVKQTLGKGVQIISVKHEGMMFRFNNGEHKRLPVKFCGRVGSRADKNISLNKEFVDVFALPEVLNTLKEIRTVDDSVEVKEEVSKVFKLETIKGVRCQPSSVKVNIKPLVFEEGTIEIPIECINEPEDKRLVLFPSRVSVVYVVELSNRRLVNKEGFQAVVDYNDVSDMASDLCKITLVKQPSFVKRAKLSVEDTKYLIEER